MIFVRSYLLLVEVGQDEAATGLQLGLCVRFVVRTRLDVIWAENKASSKRRNHPGSSRSNIKPSKKKKKASGSGALMQLTLLVVAGDLVGHPVDL